MYLDERRRGGGGSGDANLTYILAFAAQHPVGSFATVAPQPPGTQPEAFSVDSLQMTGAVVQQTGAGNRTSCPGFLARVQLPTTAGDAKGQRSPSQYQRVAPDATPSPMLTVLPGCRLPSAWVAAGQPTGGFWSWRHRCPYIPDSSEE